MNATFNDQRQVQHQLLSANNSVLSVRSFAFLADIELVDMQSCLRCVGLLYDLLYCCYISSIIFPTPCIHCIYYTTFCCVLSSLYDVQLLNDFVSNQYKIPSASNYLIIFHQRVSGILAHSHAQVITYTEQISTLKLSKSHQLVAHQGVAIYVRHTTITLLSFGYFGFLQRISQLETRLLYPLHMQAYFVNTWLALPRSSCQLNIRANKFTLYDRLLERCRLCVTYAQILFRLADTPRKWNTKDPNLSKSYHSTTTIHFIVSKNQSMKDASYVHPYGGNNQRPYERRYRIDTTILMKTNRSPKCTQSGNTAELCISNLSFPNAVFLDCALNSSPWILQVCFFFDRTCRD